MPFDPPEIDTDEDAVTDRILDGMADRIDGWEPVEGAPEVALAEELGREIAILNQSTVDVLELAIAGIGETAFGFPAFTGAAATIAVDITVNAVGSVIPAGFTVTGINADGDEIAFALAADTLAEDLIVPVTMTATEVGLDGNGVPAGDLTIITATTMVDDAVATAASADGADPELLEAYLDRLFDYLGTLRPGGVTAPDIAALARTVPGVHRAIAVDLYDPAAPLVESERTVTVFAVDETGHPVAPAVKTQLEAVLEAAREVNFIFHIEDPTYTTVAIVYDVVAEPGADTGAVGAEIDVAIATMIGTWGTTAEDDQAWVARPLLRILDVVRAIGAVAGVAYISSLTINAGTADVALDGVAALIAPLDASVDPSTISGTVT